jgi:hypothetical protein
MSDPVGIVATPGVLNREVGSDTNIDAIRKWVGGGFPS